MRWMRRFAIGWLTLVLTAGIYAGFRFSASTPIETDLLALLPPTEKSVTAEAAIKALSEQLGNHVLFLVGHPNSEQAHLAARGFATRLDASGTFARIVIDAPRTDLHFLADFYLPYRAGLLTPADRDALSRSDYRVDTVLLRRLHQPFQAGIATDLSSDPFGFLQRWLTGLPLTRTQLTPSGGLLTARDTEATWVLIIAKPLGSAFDAGTQTRIATAVNVAETAMKSENPKASLLRAGALFYGEAARSSAEREVDLIGGGSLIGVLLLMWLLFRSARPLILSLGTVACGIACAIAAVLVTDNKIHLITLVFGASLIGEAVDYAIQYFAARLDAGVRWQAEAGLARVLPGLATALATSLIGYGTLTLTPFPAISQIALFAFVGLAAAWLSVVLFLPHLSRAPSRRDSRSTARFPQRMLILWQAHITPRRAFWLVAALLIVSVPGWWRLDVDDDVRQLVARPVNLVAQEARVRALVGAGGGNGRFLLVEGRNEEEALQREEALTARLRPLVDRKISGYAAVSDFVPSAATQAAHRQLLSRVLSVERVAPHFAANNLRDSAVAAWQSSLARDVPLTLSAWRDTPLAMPMKHQILGTTDGGTALVVALTGEEATLDLSAVIAGLPGVSIVDKTASVSALFAEYRRLAALWLPLAGLIVFAVLVWRYGLQQGGAILLPTLVAIGTALGIYGQIGVPLTLFSLMALVLVLGVGANYAIFIVEAGERAPVSFAGVLLSAATTLLAFGLLTLSSMPALHQFGLLLLIGISTAVFLAPMALTLGGRSR